jgi:integrase
VIDANRPGQPRRQIRRRGFATKRDALDALDLVREELRGRRYVAPSRQTLGEWLERWLDDREVEGLKPSTINGYRHTLRSVTRHPVAEVELQELTAVDLDCLYRDLLTSGRRHGRHGKQAGEGLSPRTVRYVHTLVRKALEDARRKGAVSVNVSGDASPPGSRAAQAPESTVWQPAQLRAFLEAADETDHGPMLRLAAFSGLRRGELCGLRWSDVDLDGGSLTVRNTRVVLVHAVVEGTPKSHRPRRVELDVETVVRLRQHRARQGEQALALGIPRPEYVFTMADGKPWHPSVITRAFSRLVERMDLPRVRLHDLRHSHASHMLAAGVNARVVSERLGHATVGFTLSVYAHVLDGQQAEAAEAVARLVAES